MRQGLGFLVSYGGHVTYHSYQASSIGSLAITTILAHRIHVCSNEKPCSFQGEMTTKQQKYIDENKKSSSPEPLDQFQPNLAQSIPG